MKRNRFQNLLVAVAALLAVTLADVALAEIRFYRLRSDGNLENLHLVRGTDKPGCHDLSDFRKAHRVAVIGFRYCSVYSSDDCAAGTEIPAYWQKKPERKEVQLTEGSRWYFAADDNVKISAWQCFE